MDGWMDGQVALWFYGHMDRWLDEWLNRLIGWMDGQMHC